MRALTGAIITAGALIALGLSILAIGVRYQHATNINRDTPEGTPPLHQEIGPHRVFLNEMDAPLIYGVVFSTCGALIGLGITFVGLAYHHHRRHLENLRAHGHHAVPPSPFGTPTSTTAPPP